MGRGAGRVWRPPAPRVERARPFSDEFWRFGSDKGTSIDFGQATRAVGAAAARVVEIVSAVRATHPALYFSRMRARSRHTGVASMAAQEVDGWREQQRERVSVGCVMRDGDGAGGSGSEAARALEGDGDGVMGCDRASTARRSSARPVRAREA